MFKVVSDSTFTRPVTVLTPSNDGHLTETLKATFRLLSTDEMDKYNLNTRDGTTAYLKRIIVSLDDLASASGEPLAYTEALRDQLLTMPHVRVGLLSEYLDAVAKDPKSKN